MIFESLALLIARPVHKESVRQVNHEDRSDHFAANSQSSDARQQSDNQAESAKEFGDDHEKRHRSRHTHVFKESHGAMKAIAAKPAQHFLRAMGEKHHSENHP